MTIDAPASPAIVRAESLSDSIKVEPLTGDPYRVYTVSYVVVNQRKRAVALDLRHPDGRGREATRSGGIPPVREGGGDAMPSVAAAMPRSRGATSAASLRRFLLVCLRHLDELPEG